METILITQVNNDPMADDDAIEQDVMNFKARIGFRKAVLQQIEFNSERLGFEKNEKLVAVGLYMYLDYAEIAGRMGWQTATVRGYIRTMKEKMAEKGMFRNAPKEIIRLLIK